MEMAVYNVPWPIGVSNADIHAQPARENIFSKDVAPVLFMKHNKIISKAWKGSNILFQIFLDLYILLEKNEIIFVGLK